MWVHRDAIDANDYNPNHVAPPEMRLLRRSILSDNWLFPILVCPPAPSDVTDKPYVIVDGYHRWKVSGDKAIYALTGGYVPALILPIALDRAHRMAMTVRMNRAKGTHHVKGMAHIVGEMALTLDVEPDEVVADLGMDTEEYQAAAGQRQDDRPARARRLRQRLGSRLDDAPRSAPPSTTHSGLGRPAGHLAERLLMWPIAPCFQTCRAVAYAFGPMLASGELVMHAAVSVWTVLLGFGAAVACGITLGVLIAQSSAVSAILTPAIDALRPVAALSFFPLLILLFGIGQTSKAIVIFWTAWPPILLATVHGLSFGRRPDRGSGHHRRGQPCAHPALHHVPPGSSGHLDGPAHRHECGLDRHCQRRNAGI